MSRILCLRTPSYGAKALIFSFFTKLYQFPFLRFLRQIAKKEFSTRRIKVFYPRIWQRTKFERKKKKCMSELLNNSALSVFSMRFEVAISKVETALKQDSYCYNLSSLPLSPPPCVRCTDCKAAAFCLIQASHSTSKSS